MIAADIMTADARTIGPNATIAEAVEMMQRLEVRHLPVVDEDGELVGIVSDRDLRVLVALPNPDANVGSAEQVGEDLPDSSTAVSEIMGGDVATIEPETNVDEVIDRLLASRAGALPVVGDDGKLAGIVSYVDVLRCWQELRKGSEEEGEGEARRNGGNGIAGEEGEGSDEDEEEEEEEDEDDEDEDEEEEAEEGDDDEDEDEDEDEEGDGSGEVKEVKAARGQATTQKARPAAKKAAANRPAAKKAAAQRPAASKSAAKRPAAAAKKPAAKKSTAKKPASKKR